MAQQVLYCGVCGLPPEYCEFGPEFEKCKPWIQTHCPEVYPAIFGGAAATAAETSSTSSVAQEQAAAASSSSTPATSAAAAAEVDAAEAEPNDAAVPSSDGPPPATAGEDGAVAPDGQQQQQKKKKKGAPPENPKIVISCQARNKRKFVTTVTGLALFNIKHKDACKLFANKFSCGASLVKGKTDEIDIQGEVVEEVKTLVQETWNVADEFFVLEEAKEGNRKRR